MKKTSRGVWRYPRKAGQGNSQNRIYLIFVRVNIFDREASGIKTLSTPNALRLGAGCLEGNGNRAAFRTLAAQRFKPGMEGRRIAANPLVIQDHAVGIQHREIQVSVGAVDADRECNRVVHGVSVGCFK